MPASSARARVSAVVCAHWVSFRGFLDVARLRGLSHTVQPSHDSPGIAAAPSGIARPMVYCVLESVTFTVPLASHALTH